MTKTTITFDTVEGITVTKTDGLSETVKNIELEDLKEVFANNIPMETGMLPKGCIYMARKETHIILLIEVTPKKHSIIYRGRSTSNANRREVPMPTLVFGLHYNQGVLNHSYCATTQLPITSMETPTFRFPLGNVYDDSRICWGNVSHNPIQQILETSEIPALFFGAPFNGDLSSGAFRHNDNTSDLGPFIAHLTTLDIFPPQYLVPNNSGSNVGSILTRLKRDAGMS